MEKKIKDSNVLIAEFMGCTHPFNEIDDSTLYKIEQGIFELDELQYHTSWDWLMPVIEKSRECQLFGSQRLIDNIDKGLIKLDLIRTYRNTIDFIKWYNENK